MTLSHHHHRPWDLVLHPAGLTLHVPVSLVLRFRPNALDLNCSCGSGIHPITPSHEIGVDDFPGDTDFDGLRQCVWG